MFLATRALCRSVLSLYADVPPAQWRFAEGERGKPYIATPLPTPALHFNLTNTLGLIACVVSRVYPVLGVDAEFLGRHGETVNIAEHFFSASEVHALRTLPTEQQRERFFCYWTLKESYIKARGLGLALPLDQFSFLLDAGPDVGVAFDPRLLDSAPRWRFALLRGSRNHMVSVGVDTGGQALSLRASPLHPAARTGCFSRTRRMKMWAISDLHVGYSENREFISAIAPHPEDWLILAGDLGESVEHLSFVFATLGPRFAPAAVGAWQPRAVVGAKPRHAARRSQVPAARRAVPQLWRADSRRSLSDL